MTAITATADTTYRSRPICSKTEVGHDAARMNSALTVTKPVSPARKKR
jgi:hypothetical protein